MIKRVSTLFFLYLVIIGCNNSGGEAIDEKSYTESRESIEQQERKKPLRFLKVEGDYKKNIVGQTVVKGEITNIATIADYTNVRVKMLFYNKEKKVFENHEKVVEGVVNAGETVKFKAKFRTQQKTDSVSLSIMNASVAL